jgi:riboflavin kinase/FMN adenylyltransferase
MEVLRIEELYFAQAPSVIALGFFDGLHIGHEALLERTVAEAKERGVMAAVFTFADTPLLKDGLRLYSESERLSLFGDAGIERVYLADFPTLSPLSPEEFVWGLLLEKLSAAAVICGFNYRFGRGASGDACLLSHLLATHGVPLFPIEERTYDGITVSTTAIKAALAAGDTTRASAMLGRPFSHTGVVTHGKALGRKIGVPTANIPFPPRIFTPKLGVYAVRCQIEGVAGDVYGVANVGVRPTVEDTEAANCEVHLFSPTGDLYGKEITVHFLAFIRPEMAFSDITALRERIALDKQIAKEYFDKWNGQS